MYVEICHLKCKVKGLPKKRHQVQTILRTSAVHSLRQRITIRSLEHRTRNRRRLPDGFHEGGILVKLKHHRENTRKKLKSLRNETST